jgi:hypothetical protein
MRHLEYVLSVTLALVLLSGLAAWTQADYVAEQVRLACRSGKPTPAVTLKGMVVYPRCSGWKRG